MTLSNESESNERESKAAAPNPSTRYVLAVDLGSGGPKVALVSECGRLVAHTWKRVETHFLALGGVEQNPDDWWNAVDAGAREVLAQAAIDRKDVLAVSCTSQWAVTVPVDQQGNALMNAIHWMDSRGAPYSRAVTDGMIKVSGYGARRLWRWVRLSGAVPLHSGADGLSHSLFIKHGQPEIYQRTHKLLEPMDYLNLRLTGQFAATHATVFPFMLTDNRDNTRVDYDEQLLAWTGIDREKLPELLPVGSVLGPLRKELAHAWGLSEQTQVISATGDSHAAVLGSGAVADYAGHLCIGTSSWMSCHVPFKKTDLIRMLTTMPSAVRGRNMVVAELGAAGKCLEMFVHGWLFPSQDAIPPSADGDLFTHLIREAELAPPGCDGLLFLPWLNGTGPPSDDSSARGGFFNQSLWTTRADAVRAVLEGVALNLRWVLGAIEHFIGRPFETLNLIGGGARSELWCQITADALNRPIRVVEDPNQAIVKGAALAGFMALGHLPLERIPEIVSIGGTYEPRPEYRAVYDRQFAAFVDFYKANRRLFARLNAGRGGPRAKPARSGH